MEISVIIPTHTPQKYIKDSLDCLEKQSLSKDLFEVCIILNGATKSCENYLHSILNNYTFNYNLLTTQEKSVSNARNIGIDNTCGKYICFIDDDDCISENYLEQLFLKTEDTGTVAVSNVMTFTNNIHEAKANDYISKAFVKAQRMYNEGMTTDILKGRKFMSSSCCKIICRKDIAETRFDRNLYIGEDSFFMACISKNIKKIVLAPSDTTYYRRINNTSASRAPKTFSQHCKIAHMLIVRYIKLLNPPYKRAFIITRIIATIRSIIKYF